MTGASSYPARGPRDRTAQCAAFTSLQLRPCSAAVGSLANGSCSAVTGQGGLRPTTHSLACRSARPGSCSRCRTLQPCAGGDALRTNEDPVQPPSPFLDYRAGQAEGCKKQLIISYLETPGLGTGPEPPRSSPQRCCPDHIRLRPWPAAAPCTAAQSGRAGDVPHGHGLPRYISAR